jgi:hypothetical protein
MDSRGIPELLYDLQRLADRIHNTRLDAGQLMLSPAFQRRNTSAALALPEWAPGVMFPVAQIGDIQPIQHDMRALTELLREEQITQHLAENFIGTFDATINNLRQNSERRTAAEVNAITQLAANVYGLDARLFQTYMGNSMQKVWQLYTALGPEETYFRVMGESRPRLARRSELGKKFNVFPAGTPSSINRGFMLEAIERMMPIVFQDQTGALDSGALIEEWIGLIDPKLAKKIVRTPDERQAAQLVQQAAQIAAEEQGIDPSTVRV